SARRRAVRSCVSWREIDLPVIPGRREAASPQSIFTVRDYRIPGSLATLGSRNDDGICGVAVAMTRLSAAFGRLFNALAMAAALILLGMVVIVTADIVLRNTMGSGLVWANEVSEYSLYLMTLLTAPWLLRRGQHVRLDIILTLVPARAAWLMEAIGDLLGFVVCVVLIRYGFAMSYD